MTTVFVSGTFDILHLGHIGILEHAKSLGDELIVGVNSDARVKVLKANNRPINGERERGLMLLATKYVDKVFVFDTDEELSELASKCNIMVKGSEYRDKRIVGIEACPTVVFFDRIEEYSTAKKVQDIINYGNSE
jgi:D-beta-D-heptose 7-phosphate kinase/D-beta-D-heptose 1-phosphate adenosyltransferase